MTFKNIAKVKVKNTTSHKVAYLKFQLRRIQAEERRGKDKDLQYYFESIYKEIGDRIQELRFNNSKSNHFNFFKTPNVNEDFRLRFKMFTKEKLSCFTGDIWIEPKTHDKVRVVGVDENNIYFRPHDTSPKSTILLSLPIKDFRNKYQLFCLTLELLMENYV